MHECGGGDGIVITNVSFTSNMEKPPSSSPSFSKVLPVLFFEYLALSITRSILPGMLVDTFGVHTYFMVGVMETIKGLLAFFSCPLFGKLSDQVGRKYCLLMTVVGTTFPVCILVFSSSMFLYAFAVSLSGAFPRLSL